MSAAGTLPVALVGGEGKQPTLGTRVLACVSYGVVSTTTTLLNKAIFSNYSFHFPNILTLVQIMLSIIYMLVLRRAGVKSMQFEPFKFGVARKVLPLTLCWWIYVVSGVTALQFLSVPMFSVLRRISTLLVMLGSYLFWGLLPSSSAAGAVFVMVVGAAVASATDLSYNFWGYVYVSACVVSTAVYLLLIRKLKDELGLSESGLLFYNNVIALPLMLTYLLAATSEAREVLDFPSLSEARFQAFLLFSASQALLLNLCIFRCTSINSPLATSVTGQIKDVALTTLGILLFGDVHYHAINFLGLGLGILGGMLYSYFSYRDRNRAFVGKVSGEKATQ